MADTPNNPTPPPLGERTRAQTPNWPWSGSPVLTAGSLVLAPGGSVLNPLNFHGWLGHYAGTYDVYRWVMQHHTVRHARSILRGPVIRNSWGYVFDEAVTEEQRKFFRRELDRLRRQVVREALSALDFGCAKFEVVWDIDADGMYVIEKLKPLRVDWTPVYADDAGNFTGFGAATLDRSPPPVTVNGAQIALPAANHKAWLYTWNGEAGNLHGRSQIENFRETAWLPWLLAAQQCALIGGKISGRQAYAMVPAGSYDTPTGPRTFQQDAVDGLEAFSQGKCPVFTNLALEADDPEVQAKLAKAALIQFESIDFGDNARAIESLLGQMSHYEGGIFEGYELSPRTGMESQHGSRADSEQHTDTGLLNCEDIDDDIAEQFQPLVDAMGALDFGLPPGACRIKPNPIIDRTADSVEKLMLALASDPDVAEAMIDIVDDAKAFDVMDVPTREGANLKAALKAVKDRKAAQLPPAGKTPPTNGNDPHNGNGHSNGNGRDLLKAVQTLSRFHDLTDDDED